MRPSLIAIYSLGAGSYICEADSVETGNLGLQNRGKRGYAYNQAALVANVAESCTKCTWAYNWASTDQGLSPAIEFVPMLWGTSELFTKQWGADVQAMMAKGATHVLSFNEPDHPGQADMDASTAARAHAQYMSRVEAKVGSPAVTSSQEPGRGLQWLGQFLDACKDAPGCRVDFCAVHWYGPVNDMRDGLVAFLDQAHEVCGRRPIWLTEVGVDGYADPMSVAAVATVNEVLKSLDAKEFVERYSWFMLKPGSLLESESRWSSLGVAYISD